MKLIITTCFLVFCISHPAFAKSSVIDTAKTSAVQAATIQAEAMRNAANIQASASIIVAKTQRCGAIIVGILTAIAALGGGWFLLRSARESSSSAQKIKDKELAHEKFQNDKIDDREYATYLSICYTEAWNRKVTYENAAADIKTFIDGGILPPSSFVERTNISLFIIYENDRKYFGRMPKDAFDKATEATKVQAEYNYKIAKTSYYIKIAEERERQNDRKLYEHHKAYAVSLLKDAVTLLNKYALLMSDIYPVIERDLNRVKVDMNVKEDIPAA